MGQNLKIGAINQVEGNSVIYREGECLTSVALVLKGTARSFNAGFSVTHGPGDFIALSDLYIGGYSCTTVTATACAFYVFEAKGLDDINSILETKQEYRGYMIKSLNRILEKMYETYYSVLRVSNDTLTDANAVMGDYKQIVSSYGGDPEHIYSLEVIEAYKKPLPVKEEWIGTIRELNRIPVDVVANYYSYIPHSAFNEVVEKIKISTILMKLLKVLSGFVAKVSAGVISDGGDCLFKAICRTLMTLAPSHANHADLVELLDRIVEMVNKLEKELEKQFGQAVLVKRGQMEEMYYSVISGESADEEMLSSEETDEDIMRILENSLGQILSYGEIEEETRDNFVTMMAQFEALRDKNSTDEEVRGLRRSLSGTFFYIYKKVFMKAYKEGDYGKAVELFLHFGLMNERLLSKEQLAAIYRLKLKSTITHYCNVYTMYDWFVEIYEGRVEPSKNEMDLDYRDHVREMLGKAKLSPQEETQYMEDYDAKLDFELSNMFQHNMKLTNGKVSTYVPFLHADNMPLNVEKFYLTPTKIDEALRDILSIDFSAFYREVVYTNERIGVTREMIQVECIPNILLFPTCGSNGIMWQETANKKRESAARFCLPILCEASLEDTMIRLVARFRWELCRTLQGLAWNDIKNKCLTSEYGDYIQFYRKNKELSEDRKEKVKQQIAKARSNTKECFVIDYEQWIKFEVNASMRLNKCARDIISHYCPFAKETREKLMERPQYVDGFTKYDKEVKSRARILDAKLLGIRKNGFEVPKELELTAAYYHNK